MTMTATPAPTLTAAKTLLARLMATEDITVEQSASAKTATFNMATRVLTLPMWKDLDTDTLDMLIGHEVSHALYTPAGAEPLTKACEYIDPKNPMVAKDYINVVEDARIERLIKNDYPGLRRCFATGYRALNQRDLFGIKDAALGDLPLIDRINLQYKIGWMVEIPFTATELPIVQRVAKTSSWGDVVALSKEIYDLAKQQQQEQQQQESKSKPENGDDDDDSESDAVPSDGEQGDEDNDQQQQSQSQPSDSDGDESDDGSDSDDTQDSDGGEDGQDSEATDKKDAESEETKSETTESSNAPSSSRTMRAASENLEGMVEQNALNVYYADLPTPTEDFIVPIKRVQESLRGWAATGRNRDAASSAYGAWKSNNSSAVQILATEFDRRKAADAHKRTAIAETGSLDPNRLHAYRIAEDIFLQNTYVKDGKNHGIVLLLDMSGSMHDIFHETMVQMVTLAHFCRRVNIPFRFYGFTDRAMGTTLMPNTRVAYLADHTDKGTFNSGSFGAQSIRTALVTLLCDGMKTNEFMEQCGNLLLASLFCGRWSENHPTYKAVKDMVRSGSISSHSNYPKWMALDNTPLNAALLGMPTVISEFKNAKRLQVCNLIVLTDGEASDNLISNCTSNVDAYKALATPRVNSIYTNPARIVWRDKVTRKDYSTASRTVGNSYYYGYNNQGQSKVLLQVIADRTGAKTICIHLAMTRDANAMVRSMVPSNKGDEAMKDFKKGDYYTKDGHLGYTTYIVQKAVAVQDDGEMLTADPNAKGGLRNLRSQFTKMLDSQRANRPLLCRVADLLSK